MVNENFDKFRLEQQKHTGAYLGGIQNQRERLNNEEYNNQADTDKSPGATGRSI